MPPLQMSTTMPLSFLRPLGPPRHSTINHFLNIARLSTTSSSASSHTPPSAASSTPSYPQSTTSPAASSPSSSTNQPTPQSSPKPYRIPLTPSHNHPIYLLRKRGGNLHQTKLRKIEGDIRALRDDLQAALGMEEKDVVINHLTRQIVVKGHKKPEITKFLEGLRA